MYAHIPSFFYISFPFRSPQSTEQSSLWYIVCCHWLFILSQYQQCTYIYIYIPKFIPRPSLGILICVLYVCVSIFALQIRLSITFFFPGGSVGKESTCNAGDTGDLVLIPESGRSPGEGHGNPFQYSCLENPMDQGAMAIVHRVTKSQTRVK